MALPESSTPPRHFNVRDFGATGDGHTLDTSAVQRAIEAAAAAGGGTVDFPTGTYACFTLHLRSRVTLHLRAGATLLAAAPSSEDGGYDSPEPNRWGDELQYQDFGHSHWRNSLLVGEAVHDIAIIGDGRIDGAGLLRHATYRSEAGDPGPNGTVPAGTPVTIGSGPGDPAPSPVNHGNKAIALRECHDVTLAGFQIYRGGHFALLATGCRDLHIARLLIDTNRDGLDIDGCQRVTIEHCTVNSPLDDAIVLKSSYALGRLSPCEDIRIAHCTVSGYDIGTVLDGSRGIATTHAPDQDGPTGRIKIGTETNSDFRRIHIHDCRFERSRGLALETVDGATIEEVVVERLDMRDVTSSALFLIVGRRARGPASLPVGVLRNVTIRHVTARHVDGRFPVILQGLPDSPLKQVTLQHIHVESRGGITRDDVARQNPKHVNPFFLREEEAGVTGPRDPGAAGVPSRPDAYPEPSMFGLLPSSGLWARHVRHLVLDHVTCTTSRPDERPVALAVDVTNTTVVGGNLHL